MVLLYFIIDFVKKVPYIVYRYNSLLELAPLINFEEFI